MKRLLVAASTLLLAAAALGAETAPQPATATADSPLVSAAKSTRRTGKKSIVITNESIKNSKGHITSTRRVPDLPKVRPLPPAAEAVEKKPAAPAVDKAAEAKKAEDARKERMARLAGENIEPGLSEMDPAELEHQLDTSSQPAPPPAEPKKP